MTLLDTNILLDIIGKDSLWSPWSERQVIMAARKGDAFVNVIVIAELSRDFATIGDIKAVLESLSVAILELDEHPAFIAGKRFADYRRRRTSAEPGRVLPDFLIGAHALVLGSPLVTRDTAIFRTYFPDLSLITPEMHP